MHLTIYPLCANVRLYGNMADMCSNLAKLWAQNRFQPEKQHQVHMSIFEQNGFEAVSDASMAGRFIKCAVLQTSLLAVAAELIAAVELCRWRFVVCRNDADSNRMAWT
jgi:hypothetical protein